ncbi:methyltransferase domain-containing protein [Lutimaribacter sp. EGI FJ00015]|uniref:Methyltransferase domain-containing protein n=1 Tax=Lutimaribacter degradans TaxID=2945989 RepID=A0ACC5ZVG8_9RHOB|nr:transcription antitermination factor NusB [Lutimaribacter sp. EGI FJ00013]MCM2561845.1 methyltransferase domain-containing protein [Lutimaribacter sp. EGI FJ00013]MCO0613123.1 methyltransferase domain-containing protein [Lutimaribacter sp. EGI FJ00015]MCO0635677.1 methyltransferase domain-containing protein [Lutimaribacter sp. EGI FJ00014]
MTNPASFARRSAVAMLDKVLGEGRLMAELAGLTERLDPADRARAQRLTVQTLRGLERADRLLSRHLRKNPPLHVRNILRLATVELCMGGDAHGVVNDAVALTAADRKGQHMKGMVNAVLRKIAEGGPAAWANLRVPRLPKWLRAPLADAWGGAAIAAMEVAHFAGAPLDLTVKDDAEGWADRLGGVVTPFGSVRLKEAGQVSALPGFAEGAWWVQDAAAAIPARLLATQPGEAALDMCAAPGGKTLQLAAVGADVTALDLSEARLARVTENLARTGLTARVVAGDALEHEGRYDAILLDAPCSATGTIRRHPDLPHAKDGSEFGALIEMQAAMLDHALSLLRPGGRLVFCTCSLLPDEGEVQVDEALARHDGLVVDRAAVQALPGVDPAWITEEGGLRLRPDYWPDLGGMDGFYMALLRKG